MNEALHCAALQSSGKSESAFNQSSSSSEKLSWECMHEEREGRRQVVKLSL
jgi:hypothetical protein